MEEIKQITNQEIMDKLLLLNKKIDKLDKLIVDIYNSKVRNKNSSLQTMNSEKIAAERWSNFIKN